MKKFLIAAAALVALASPALAADMAPVYTKAPAIVPVPVVNWTGWYVGLNAGGYTQDDRLSSYAVAGPCSAALAGCTAVPNYSTLMANGATFGSGGGSRTGNGGFIGGAQFGYNWQSGLGVFGFEADIQGLSNNNNNNQTVTVVTPSTAFPAFPLTTVASATEKLDYLGTVRGRVGWLASPSFLLYGTGGLAYGEVKQSGILTQSIAAPDPSTPAPGVGGNTTTRAGYVVGGGAEWMAPSSNWSVKVEAMYYDLGTVSYALSPSQVVSTATPGLVTGSALARYSNRVDGVIARVGINWHFGGPVVARY
jgi:outer membrane immunogenic protein